MKRVKIAVVGAGRLGSIHAKLVRELPEAELAAIVEPVESLRTAAAQTHGCPAYASLGEAAGAFEAAIVAAPTIYHHALTLDLISQGIHVLVEKPIAATVEQAEEMVDSARAAGVVLQTGHVERFNPAVAAMRSEIGRPKYFEAVRSSTYTFRSTDVGVVLDLMIHDIDLALATCGGGDAEVTRVDAIGVSLFGGHEDLAQARLAFSNGAVANLSASRASFSPQRTVQTFSETCYATLDLAKGTAKAIRPCEEVVRGQIDWSGLGAAEQGAIRDSLFATVLPLVDVPVPPGNAILEEQRDFVRSIRTGRSPQVTGEAGLGALRVAQEILTSIARHSWGDGRYGASLALLAPIRRAA